MARQAREPAEASYQQQNPAAGTPSRDQYAPVTAAGGRQGAARRAPPHRTAALDQSAHSLLWRRYAFEVQGLSACCGQRAEPGQLFYISADNTRQPSEWARAGVKTIIWNTQVARARPATCYPVVSGGCCDATMQPSPGVQLAACSLRVAAGDQGIKRAAGTPGACHCHPCR